jgi:hypothetical protein
MLGEAREEPVEIMAGELPGEGSGGLLVTFLEGKQAFCQDLKVGKVIGGEYLALHHREIDLDLVEPGGVHRKVDEPQVGPGTLQPIDGSLPTVAALPLSTIQNTRSAEA